MVVQLDLEQARRIAVRAQLLSAERPDDLLETVRQLTVVQLEPTAPIAPTADLVLWSRLGDAYRPSDLTDALERDGTLVELDLMARPMEDLALFKAEMDAWPTRESTRIWLDDNVEFAEDVLERLELDGPLTSRDIADTSLTAWPSSGWNGNRNVIMMLECLGRQGRIAVVGHRGRDRVWDLAERVFHADIPTIPFEEAQRIRDERRLRSYGIQRDSTAPRVGDAGLPATVDGVRGRWRVDPEALDQPFEGRTALLSPFDGLLRDRKRMELLWGFDYSLDMYKPAHRRRWGYYALPILHGDALVGKVDATTDRDAGVLRVDAVHEDVPFDSTLADAVDAELESLARWLGVRLRRM